jgi:glutamyl-tRNA reductase
LNISQPEKFTHELLTGELIQECLVLQTCHRVEVFYVSSEAITGEATKQALKTWSTQTGISIDIIRKTVQVFEEREAVRHLFYLASGLDSVILGEDQILGQVHSAWLKAKAEASIGVVLDRAFMKAINIGRKVRNETRINEGAVSVSSAAVDLAARELGNLESRKALIVGAGEAGTLAAETLKNKAVSAITVANRTYEKSLLLAQKISGKAIQFNDIFSTIPNMDLVITALSVTEPLFKEEQFAPVAVKFNDSKRLLLIDISQPRSIEEKIGSLEGISLKTIDDLKELVSNNMKNRELEAEKSRAIIAKELGRFEVELCKLVAQPLISEIFRKFETVRQKELKRAIRKMGESDERKLIVMERFSKELVERVAQIPVEQLRKAALNNNNELLSAAKKIFHTGD